MIRLPSCLLVLALAASPAWSLPVASFAQTQTSATPFTYNAATGEFGATTAVVFNFLAPNSSGVAGPVAATLTLNGTTTGPVTVGTGGALFEYVNAASFSIVASSGPLAGQDLLSGTFTGAFFGQGSVAGLGGSQVGNETLTFTSAFLYNVGAGLQSLGDATVFGRDAVFGLAGITPGPLTQSGGNLSGSPAPSNWSSSISGSFSATPEPATLILAGLGLGAVLVVARRRQVAD